MEEESKLIPIQPENYESPILEALGDVGIQNENLNADSVAVVAPFFPNPSNPRGVIASDEAGANGLVWSANAWYYGAQSIYPSNTSSVSSFSVVDQMIQYFDNKALFPNLQTIVIAGHSMGSMFVNRYAAIGKQLNTAAALTYVSIRVPLLLSSFRKHEILTRNRFSGRGTSILLINR